MSCLTEWRFVKSVYCGRKTVNWSDVNSEKATKTEPLRMNCGRCYEKQGKTAVTEAVWDGAFSCHLQCPLEEVPVIFLKVKVKYKKTLTTFEQTATTKGSEKCDFGGWVGGMVGALHICATLWYDEGVFVSKTLLFSNWFKISWWKWRNNISDPV